MEQLSFGNKSKKKIDPNSKGKLLIPEDHETRVEREILWNAVLLAQSFINHRKKLLREQAAKEKAMKAKKKKA